ncbi:choice-of-anchor L domain-containing protein [Chondromyces apiculatus]|uniref:Uncharacterized protein n=1 Tax=Chondromyces apiculatus DSM 436 TaxID=1192034 RepID=A0A017TI26_9BACT|nr:choice-of-anchor L domain-containing protein [Chondromyces apiculatus]EYF08485.1 Hypothetical protein CAP_4014 [Chondromyces apiculatus DSM 436]
MRFLRSSPLALPVLFLCAGYVGVTACSALGVTNEGFGASSSTGGGEGGAGGGEIDLTTSSTGTGAGGPLTEEPPCEGMDPNADNDGDGVTGAAGDCNDCTTQMNPGAMDYPGNSIDEDCNGFVDDDPANCDTGLPVAADARTGARAMDFCKDSDGTSWGVVSAEWVTADGQPLNSNYAAGVGVLSGFGPAVQPQAGQRLLALSSGAARQPSDSGYQSPSGYVKGYTSGAPPGYPKESPACPGVQTGIPYDSAGLRVTVKTPTNAKSLRFNLNFYTYEFPVYVCSQYNDFFVAMLSPQLSGTPDGNISFDSQGNTISVNAGFLQVCHAQQAGGQNYPCPLGAGQLSGTGFDDFTNSAATAWLQTTAPIENPGSNIELHFTIWDSGDGDLDSTVLLDNFAFEAIETTTETQPVPPPE